MTTKDQVTKEDWILKLRLINTKYHSPELTRRFNLNDLTCSLGQDVLQSLYDKKDSVRPHLYGYVLGRKLGQSESSKHRLATSVISRLHAQLNIDEKGQICLTDLASAHGTLVIPAQHLPVNEYTFSTHTTAHKLKGLRPFPLVNGDRITFGKLVTSSIEKDPNGLLKSYHPFIFEVILRYPDLGGNVPADLNYRIKYKADSRNFMGAKSEGIQELLKRINLNYIPAKVEDKPKMYINHHMLYKETMKKLIEREEENRIYVPPKKNLDDKVENTQNVVVRSKGYGIRDSVLYDGDSEDIPLPRSTSSPEMKKEKDDNTLIRVIEEKEDKVIITDIKQPEPRHYGAHSSVSFLDRYDSPLEDLEEPKEMVGAEKSENHADDVINGDDQMGKWYSYSEDGEEQLESEHRSDDEEDTPSEYCVHAPAMDNTLMEMVPETDTGEEDMMINPIPSSPSGDLDESQPYHTIPPISPLPESYDPFEYLPQPSASSEYGYDDYQRDTAEAEAEEVLPENKRLMADHWKQDEWAEVDEFEYESEDAVAASQHEDENGDDANAEAEEDEEDEKDDEDDVGAEEGGEEDISDIESYGGDVIDHNGSSDGNSDEKEDMESEEVPSESEGVCSDEEDQQDDVMEDSVTPITSQDDAIQAKVNMVDENAVKAAEVPAASNTGIDKHTQVVKVMNTVGEVLKEGRDTGLPKAMKYAEVPTSTEMLRDTGIAKPDDPALAGLLKQMDGRFATAKDGPSPSLIPQTPAEVKERREQFTHPHYASFRPRTPSVSDASSSGPITPPSNSEASNATLVDTPSVEHSATPVKRKLDEAFAGDESVIVPLESTTSIQQEVTVKADGKDALIQESKVKKEMDTERPIKRHRSVASAIGLVALGAVLGSAGTIAGLMQLGD